MRPSVGNVGETPKGLERRSCLPAQPGDPARGHEVGGYEQNFEGSEVRGHGGQKLLAGLSEYNGFFRDLRLSPRSGATARGCY